MEPLLFSEALRKDTRDGTVQEGVSRVSSVRFMKGHEVTVPNLRFCANTPLSHPPPNAQIPRNIVPYLGEVTRGHS